jgi:hypothetical protein
MENKNKLEDKGSLAIGGGLLMGLGVGFFFIRINPMAFVGSLLFGLGLGLLVSALISRSK